MVVGVVVYDGAMTRHIEGHGFDEALHNPIKEASC
jgi:hypothetical protein